MVFNPVVAMLRNTKTRRWHPIFFEESALPDPPSPDQPVRHKSGAHHAEGFDTREAALQGAKVLAEALVKEGCAKSCKFALAEDILWDGEAVPASVAFFTELPDGTMKRVG